MDELEPTIVERYAEHLTRRADTRSNLASLVGALLGGLLGAVPLTAWAAWPVTHTGAYGTLLLGVVAGGYLGRGLARPGADELRLRAEVALHRLEFERRALAPRSARSPVPASAPPAPAVPATPPVSPPAPASAQAVPRPVPSVPVPPVGYPPAPPLSPPLADTGSSAQR